MVGNGDLLPITQTGKGLLPTPSRKLRLNPLHFVPTLHHNLLSLNKLITDNGCSVLFDSSGYTIKDPTTNHILLRGQARHGLYPIFTESPSPNTALVAVSSTESLWHRRLGHPSYRVLQKLQKYVSPQLSFVSSSFHCNACELAKSHKLPFTSSISRSSSVLQLIHSDVWGPSSVISLQGYKYYIIFVDDFSRFSWLFPLTAKSEVPLIFVRFQRLVERQFNAKIKIFRSDGGGEYTSKQFQSLLATSGIVHQLTCPYTPEQNGLAERKHRHIIETTRALLFHSNIPQKFWIHAVQTVVHLINRLPSLSNKLSSPYQMLFNKPPDYNSFRIFGCLCYPFLPQAALSKFHPKSIPCVFVGYPLSSKGYICYNISSGKFIVSRHVKFLETIFPFQQSTPEPVQSSTTTYTPPLTLVPTMVQPISISPPPSSKLPPPQSTLPPAETATLPTSSTAELPQSSPVIEPPASEIPSHPMLTRSRTGNLKPKHILSMNHFHIPVDPTCYSQAVKSSAWRQAMSAEFEALQHQGTWQLVPPHPSQNVLSCKWIYKSKLNSDGSIARHKARLVARGCHQQYGLDYEDTFSPVAKLPTIRIFLKVAVTHHWQILQLDVSNAFLHGRLHDTVFMTQPQGFVDPSFPDHVCLLKKAIYGLKQSPRKWFETFSTYLLNFGFTHSTADPSLLLYCRNSIHIYILVYVDDILLTGNHNPTIEKLLLGLSTEFHMKNLGQVSYFLGIQILHTSDGLHLSQSSYARDLLTRAGMTECKPISSPIPTKVLSSSAHLLVPADAEQFRHLVGSLQYLTITRPDISFTVNKLCQHMHQPLEDDFKLLKRLLRYIKGTIFFGLPVRSGSHELIAYSDSDWAGDPSNRKSTSGYCAFLGDTLISWFVKKQKTVARSSTEAEYRALATAATDLIWLRRLLAEFHISSTKPTLLLCDNISVIALAHNPIFHARTKHVEIDFHFIRDCIKNQVLKIAHVYTADQLADLFTKSLSISRFTSLRDKLTLAEAPVSLRGRFKKDHLL
ncbi:Retrovirus-related Pol polyprotein from transposon TNT 1-94 [Dendrobium catenatum]|uniref:Retrovirus-related Pol polyprotein from transposon TNT 1-94 n=1 Tax=Dendrobium catenatum TaxID=906689 RepID=A0A2I0XE34_9ASPA|nr:Retrovirus-related Pol polyprotein from transposon TNT 1-94 [Dendrobium catenatum]